MTKGVNPDTGKHYRFKDRTGERKGRLVFTEHLGEDKHRHTVWKAVCDCGNTTTTSQPHKTQSCGCLQKEVAAKKASERALPKHEKARRELENRKRQRDRRKNDPVLAMQARLSRLHRHALSSVGEIKSSSTFDLLGYTPREFKEHIEKQFTDGMGWHNMDQWQIDHITPSSEAVTKEDVIRLNQLFNLRPVWARENNKKKNKREFLL